MYERHFGLRELPFGLTPDTAYAYTSTSHQEALNTLLVAARNGEGFMKITGEVGTGKTLLCRTFLTALQPSFVSAYILNPYLPPRALLRAIAAELGVTLQRHDDQHDVMKALTNALLDFAAHDKPVVICLDEAQAMPIESLEALRLLTNLETEKRRLVQVVLFGQPEVDVKLAHVSVRQLRQRITFQYRLRSLAYAELGYYLAHRLRVAGYRGPGIFPASALRVLQRATRGVPRLVNIVSHKAMLLAYGEGLHEAGAKHVRAAVNDTPAARQSPWSWLRSIYGSRAA
jgi:MSHA biogenesis protein MshM